MSRDRVYSILYVIGGGIKNGGTEAVVMNYYRHIDKDKYHIDFVFHGLKEENDKHPYYKELLDSGAKIFFVTPRGVSVSKNIEELKAIMTSGGYDAVHAHGDAANAIILKVAKGAGIGVRISHSHNTGIQLKVNGPKALAHMIYLQNARRRVRKIATHYMACGKAAGTWLYGQKSVDEGKVYILNNAVDVDRYAYNEQKRIKVRTELGINDKTILIGNVGRISDMKNQEFLLDVVDQYREEHPDKEIKVILIGEDCLDGKLQAENHRDVIFYGLSQDIPGMLSGMDLYTMPSKFEGLPVALIEAQANGIKCLISDEGHITSEADITECIHRANIDSVAEWCKALDSIIQDVSRLDTKEKIVKAGYSIVEEAHKLEEYYMKVSDTINEY